MAAEEEERELAELGNKAMVDALWKINTYRRSLAVLSVTWGCRLHDPALFPQLHQASDLPTPALPSFQVLPSGPPGAPLWSPTPPAPPAPLHESQPVKETVTIGMF